MHSMASVAGRYKRASPWRIHHNPGQTLRGFRRMSAWSVAQPCQTAWCWRSSSICPTVLCWAPALPADSGWLSPEMSSCGESCSTATTGSPAQCLDTQVTLSPSQWSHFNSFDLLKGPLFLCTTRCGDVDQPLQVTQKDFNITTWSGISLFYLLCECMYECKQLQ